MISLTCHYKGYDTYQTKIYCQIKYMVILLAALTGIIYGWIVQ